jgi:glycosyltransferase involved in cell wall biosynthesis
MRALKIIFDANPLARNKTGVGHFTEQIVLHMANNLGPAAELIGYYIASKDEDLTKKYGSYRNIRFKRISGITARILSVLRRLYLQPPIDALIGNKVDIALFTNYVSMPLLFGGKSALFIYDLSYIDCPEFVAERNRNYLKKWVAKRIKKADKVLTISNFVKRRIIEEYNFPADRIFVTPIPPKPMPNEDKGIFEELGLAGDYMLFVGTIEPRKNIANLLIGYSKMSPEVRDKYSLVLAGGDGWLDSEINETLSRLKQSGLKIFKTGYISEPELTALYKKSTLVVQPSHYEGFGMPILEAMGYGKPVACSDIEVFREISADAALFFNKDDPENIAEVLENKLNNPALLAKIAQSGSAAYENYDDWKSVSKKFYDFLMDNKTGKAD